MIAFTTHAASTIKPADFVKLNDIDPTIIESPRYATSENFLGRIVPGYHPKTGIYCTRATALALKDVQKTVREAGYGLVIYDAYRPQRAVNAFIAWSKTQDDQPEKAHYYPTISKSNLFALGYLREKSGHSRGSTIDLTLIPLNQGLKKISYNTRQLSNDETIPFLDDNTVDMGSSFDLLHPASHHNSPLITSKQTEQRERLRQAMKAHGFQEVDEEWWHYTLIHEPYPSTYFDFESDTE